MTAKSRWHHTPIQPNGVGPLNVTLRRLDQVLNDQVMYNDAPSTIVGVNVKGFGARGDGFSDDTTPISAALATGDHVIFPDGVYLANNLIQSADQQRLIGLGNAQLVKNANGTLLSCAGDMVVMENLQFRGESATPTFTGDNVSFSGDNCAMLMCASQWAFGRAVKATGSHFQIIGTCGVFQTADATATGYDIEIGLSGTATLYHHLEGVYTSQQTGGILATDTGAMVVMGGQFGKFKIAAGTAPAGSGGNKAIGARILGAVDVNLSNAAFAGNTFGAVVVTLGVGTSGITIDESNTFQSGATVTNNGNANNVVIRQTSAGGTMDLLYGDDSALSKLSFSPTAGWVKSLEGFHIPNNKTYVGLASGGGTGFSLTQTAADNFGITNAVSGKAIIYTVAGAGQHSFDTNGGTNRPVNIDTNGISVSGTATIKGAVSVSSSLTVGGALSVAGATVLSAGLTVGGALSVSADTTLKGALSVVGAVVMSAGATIGGELTVSAAGTFKGALSVSATAAFGVHLSTDATTGFVYVPTCSGTPTGTPVSVTGTAPIIVDRANNKLFFHSNGAWRDAGP